MSPQSRVAPKKEEVEDGASFTEIMLEVRPEERSTVFSNSTRRGAL
jgi:hypothetical protein